MCYYFAAIFKTRRMLRILPQISKCHKFRNIAKLNDAVNFKCAILFLLFSLCLKSTFFINTLTYFFPYFFAVSRCAGQPVLCLYPGYFITLSSSSSIHSLVGDTVSGLWSCSSDGVETLELSEHTVNPGEPKTGPYDFELLKLLGKGGYGKV